MMLSGQSGRDIDEDMFAQENSTCPPSLSSHGQMHKGTKSDILKCLVGDIEDSTSDTSPYSDVVILDGAFIVQSLRPGTASTFQDYAEKVFLPYVMSWLKGVYRLDIVWDAYKLNSLKASTREIRGSGMRCRVTSTTKIPSNWQGFLRVDENKSELFSLLAQKIQEVYIEG